MTLIRPLFEKWLAPFRDMGVTTVSLKSTGGTDHLSFDEAGIPGFQFIQDPLDYGSMIHHSDIDTYSHAVPEDLMQCSAVIATLVYDIANPARYGATKRFGRKREAGESVTRAVATEREQSSCRWHRKRFENDGAVLR